MLGPAVGAAIASAQVSDCWFYLNYKYHHRAGSALIDVPRDSSARLLDKAASWFGSRGTVADFRERDAEIKLKDLMALDSKQKLKVDKQNHPCLKSSRLSRNSPELVRYLLDGSYFSELEAQEKKRRARTPTAASLMAEVAHSREEHREA
ncbi:MAG: hypothetical protein WB714_00315 [Candidatus Sulfotelmatobacter sp.]